MATKALEIDVVQTNGVAVVTLDGALDASSVEQFQDTLGTLCERQGGRVLLDCSNLSYVNSTSFGLFFKYHRSCAQHGGVFAMCGVWDKVMHIVSLLGLDKFLKIYPDRATALKSLPRKGNP
jgi:anti-anti-sigma factor